MTRLILVVLSLIVCDGAVHAQSCRIETIGKPVQTYKDGGSALDAVIRPSVATDDSNGNVYFFDEISKRILKITPGHTIHTVAGTGQSGSDGDGGPATQAQISVISLVSTPEGVIYFSDQSRIRRIDRNGIIQTVAGTGKAAFNLNSGPALTVQLNLPQGLHYGKDQHLYFADRLNNRIRKLTPDGQIISLAGSNRGAGKWVDGKHVDDLDEGDGHPATQAYVPSPLAVSLLPDGQIVFQDYRSTPVSSWRVRVIDQEGNLRTIYSAKNNVNLQVDPLGNMYVTTNLFGTVSAIRKQLLLNGEQITPVDGGEIPSPENSYTWHPAPSYTLLPSGDLFRLRQALPNWPSAISDLLVNQIWIQRSGQFQHIAGRAYRFPAIQDGPVSSVSFPTPADIGFDQNGGFYFLDGAKNLIYHVNAQQQIRRFFGGGQDTNNPDGKHPLQVQQAVLGIAVRGPNELIVAMPVLSTNGTWTQDIQLYSVTSEKITTIRTSNGDDVVIRNAMSWISGGKSISVGSDGTIFVLLKNGFKTDVKTIDLQKKLRTYTLALAGSYYPVRMEDGRVVAASLSGNYPQNFQVYHLTASGPGERVHELEGTATTQIAQVREDAYLQSAFYRSFFKRSMEGNQWRKILLDQVPFDSFGPAQFVGFGWKNSPVFTTTAGINLVSVINPDGCPYISSPEVTENSLVNSASYARPGTIAPGQLLTFWGKNLNPAEGIGLTLRPDEGVAFPSEGVSLQFRHDCSPYSCEYPAQLIFGNDSQANLQMAVTSAPLKEKSFEAYLYWENVYIPFPGTLKFVSTNPGLFVINGGKDGQGAILNQNGSVNSTTNPAATGSVVSLYATGLGEYDWSFVTGTVIPSDFLVRLKASVTVRIGGKNAEVLYAGGSPGSIFGLNQINVKIPEGVSGPEVEVELDADGASTSGTQRVTLAVQ